MTERALPTGYRICAACGQGAVAPGRPCPNCGAGIGAAPAAPAAPAKPTARPGPNVTELEAQRVLNLPPVVFEDRTFVLLNGTHSYTPDWYGSSMAIEVKGEHVHSRDARILFDAARAEYPELTWVWARKRSGAKCGKRGARWEVTIWPAKGDTNA